MENQAMALPARAPPNAVLSSLFDRAGLCQEVSGKLRPSSSVLEELPAQLVPEGSLEGLMGRTSQLILPAVTG